MIGVLKRHAQRTRQTLWALIVAPSAWGVHFLFCYFYAAVHCAKAGRAARVADIRLEISVATLLALAVVVVAGFVAWAQSQIEGDPPPHQQSTKEDRLRFLAVATLLLAGLSFIAIVFTAIPAFVFGDCR